MELIGRITTLMTLVAICFIHFSVSWPQMIANLEVCKNFQVSHTVRPQEVSPDAVSVILKGVKDDVQMSCVKPSTLYHVEFRSNERTLDQDNLIKGILVKQESAGDKTPPGKVLGRDRQYLPKNTVHGVCGSHSIAHLCPPGSNTGCKLGDEGKWLNITYEAPSKLKVKNIIFRYSVVLSRVPGGTSKYIANQTVKFPVCPPVSTTAKPPSVHTTNQLTTPTDCPTHSLEAHETNSAEEPVQYCSNFQLKNGAVKQNESCGKESSSSNETHIYTDPITGINYTCHTNKSVRKVHCKPTCLTGNNRQLCCRNTISKLRPRDFMCYASSLLNPDVDLTEETRIIERLGVQVLQTKQCECFLCKDILCTTNC